MTLEGHWPLTEDSGSTAYDYSGNEKHGDVTGAGPVDTGTVTGPFGNSAYDFDGSDDFIDTNYNGSPYSQLTVSYWVNTDDISTFQVLIDQTGTGSSDRTFNTSVDTSTANSIEFRWWDSGDNASVVNTTTDKNSDTWYHIVLVWNGSTIKIYADGVEEGSTSVSDSASSGNTVKIGKRDRTDNTFLDGSLSNVRIYERALSTQEIQALYQAGRQSEVVFK